MTNKFDFMNIILETIYMIFELPKLKYSYSDLEPYIDATTVELHYSKHHQTYINNLNKALETHSELADWDITKLLTNLDKLPEDIKNIVRNNAGGHSNHTLYWETMTKNGSKLQNGKLLRAIDNELGGFDNLKTQITQEALKRFGSGWAWLVLDDKNKLQIYSTANQDSPLMQGHKPLLGIDVWEHAYYLKYQNKRADYIEAWFNLVDWEIVEKKFN